ncbi:helix-turn-helix domain-containing protein [Sinorhizobium meliloti]
MSQPSVSQALQRLEEQLDHGDFNDFVLHVA